MIVKIEICHVYTAAVMQVFTQ